MELQEGRYEDARSIAERSANTLPASDLRAQLWLVIAEALREEGAPSLAEGYYRKSIEDGSNEVQAEGRFLLAECQLKLGRINDARYSYAALDSRSKFTPRALRRLAEIDLTQRNFEGVITWIDEGRELNKVVPSYAKTMYRAPSRDDRKIRAFRNDVQVHLDKKLPLVDVRSPGEYSGQLLHMADYPQEGAMRGGHIPGAKNIPWAKAVAEDGTFKSAADLKELYGTQGITPDKDIVAYCRIGERSSHTWFVLTYLLGYPSVRNYDGSWTEWGNLVGAPIEK